MKKSFRLLAMLFSLASIGVFLFMFGYLISLSNNTSNISENQPKTYKYLFLKLTSKPQDLVAQAKEIISEKKQQPEKQMEAISTPSQVKDVSEINSDSTKITEKNDTTTNTTSEEVWIQQLIQLNGCFDMCNDFVEKEWMKEHNFIIL